MTSPKSPSPARAGSRTQVGLAFAGIAVLLAGVFALGGLADPTGMLGPDHDALHVVEGPPPTKAPPHGAPNVLLIIGCTLRKDQATPYAPDLPTMPFLGALADQGARFDDLITAAPWTKTASTAILTGHHALEVGMVEEGPRRNDQALPPEVATLAQHFHEAGYRTVGATANPNLHHSYGFHRGFQRYRQGNPDWGGKGGVKVPGDELADAFLDDLDAIGTDAPFYAQVLFVDAHAPFPDRAAVGDVPGNVIGYRVVLGRLDEAIARLVDGLEARGVRDDTLIVVVNDHGEGLHYPAHHGKSHGRYLSPSTVGGVGVIAGPGIPAGHHVSGLASQIDLAPTIWSLAGLPPGPSWSGTDLSRAVRGETTSTGRDRVYTDTWFRKASRAAFYERDRACQIAVRERKLTDRNGVTFQSGCFDRHADPTHTTPLHDQQALQELATWREAALKRGRALAIEKTPASEEVDRQLEALGYVD